MAPLSVRADCYSTYTNAAASCAAAQAIRDQIIWTWLDSHNSDALGTLNNELYIDLSSYNYTVDVANITDGTLVCDGQYDNTMAALAAANDLAVKTCMTNYYYKTNDWCALDQCLAPTIVDYGYGKDKAWADRIYCETGQGIKLNWDVSEALALKSYSDSAAYHDYDQTIGYDYAKSDGAYYLSDQYYAPLCYSPAGNDYNNCVLDTDCSQHPANCCADGCVKTYNNSMQNAYVTDLNAVGPATATYVYQVEMCSVNLQADDSKAQYHAQKIVDDASAGCAKDVGTAGKVYTYTIAMDAAVATKQSLLCGAAADYSN